MENQNPNNQLQIELKEEVAQGTYANLAIITHSSSEFILDFVRVMPGIPKAGVQSRVVLAPEHAKRLHWKKILVNMNGYLEKFVCPESIKGGHLFRRYRVLKVKLDSEK